MEYRRLGRSGVKVSLLSFGSWVTFSNQMDLDVVTQTMQAAREAGVNFFDNAEAYANGKSEEMMGAAFKKLGWSRLSYLVSTKFFWGIEDGPNSRHTLNRKYLLESITGSLRRLQMDHVDLVYCHRPDPHTPIEETVQAMHDIVQRGYALYWGTSEWSAEEIRAAWLVADRYGWHKPVVEQPQYNLFHRRRVEREYARLYEDLGLGLTIWSPLASGILTGKYLSQIPKESRAAVMGSVGQEAQNPVKKERVQKLMALAQSLDVTAGQLALAWCASNPQVSSVITGASRLSQVEENMKALRVLPLLTTEIKQELDHIFPVGEVE